MTPKQHTAAIVRTYRRVGVAARRRKIPKQQIPKLIESDYAKAIINLLQRAQREINAVLPQILRLVSAGQSNRIDNSIRLDAGETKELRRLLESARKKAADGIKPTEIEELAKLFAQRTSTFQRVQLGRQTRAAFGVDVLASDKRLPAIVEHFTAENVALIKTIPSKLFDDVEKITSRAFSAGTLPTDLTDEIQELYDVGERHARLIARDQIGKLNGQLNEERQTDLGIDTYVWRTVGDERVREEHAALDGETFSWDDPPEPGHPGEDFQCRCWAEPNLSPILDEVQSTEE